MYFPPANNNVSQEKSRFVGQMGIIYDAFHYDFVGDEDEKPDAPDGDAEGAEPLPEHLTEDQTVWFDAISEGNVMEIKELLDGGSDSGWKNKVK